MKTSYEALKEILPLAEAYLRDAPSHPDNAKLEDARALISAAPDMLLVLRELIDIEGPIPGTNEWSQSVLKVIEKAEGLS